MQLAMMNERRVRMLPVAALPLALIEVRNDADAVDGKEMEIENGIRTNHTNLHVVMLLVLVIICTNILCGTVNCLDEWP